MHRCYIESSAWMGTELCLSPEESHHLFNVLRAAVGDEVFVFDGAGRSARALVKSVEPAVLDVIDEDVPAGDAEGGVTLFQALPKGKRMDLIVEKATELGVARIVPLITERVISRPKDDRVERWRRIVLSAAKQCGAKVLPEVTDIMSYADGLAAMGPFDLLLVCSLGSDARKLSQVLRERKGGSLGVIIGPEGDLTQAEIDLAIDSGAVPVSLGELVLRVETAALYVLSAISYESV